MTLRRYQESLGWAATVVVAATATAASAQLLRHAYLRHVAHTFVWMSRDAFWMTPLATLLIVIGVAVGSALVMRLIRPRLVRPTVGAACLTVAMFSAMLCFTAIHPLASLLLSAGVGVRGFMAWRDTPDRTARWTRTAALVGSILLGAVVLAARVSRDVGGDVPNAVATARAPKSDAKMPNVIVLILDTVRASSLSLYGWNLPTSPVLAQLADESTVYDLAIAPSSWSLPSHASMFTGVRTELLHSDPLHPVQLTTQTLAQALRSRGYATGAFTANLVYTTYESGMMQGFDVVDDYRVTPTEVMLHANIMQLPVARQLVRARSARALATALKASLESMPGEPKHVMRDAADVLRAFRSWESGVHDRPYMAFINLFDAHGEMPVPPTGNPALLKRRGAEGDYERRISYVDGEIGRLIADLRATGTLDNTLLIATSDHGEQFGEHGLIGHGNSLYMSLLHVPLLVRFPGAFAAGRRIGGPLSLADLPATVASVVGLQPSSFPGNPWPTGAEAVSDSAAALAEVGHMVTWGGPAGEGALSAIVTQQHLLIEREDGMRELFDYRQDPTEHSNLAPTPSGEQLTPVLQQRMRSVKRARGEVPATRD